jgi:hypothetical protein
VGQYLKVSEIETEGNKLERIRKLIAEKAGPNAAKGIQTAETFNVIEIRPLVDFGQGWENLFSSTIGFETAR